MPRRGLVARFIARAGIGIAMLDVGIVGRTGQANDHAIVMNGPHARGMFGRLGGIAALRLRFYRKWAGPILGCGHRVKSEGAESENES